VIQVAGECEVLYDGRASSTADAGDFLVLIKTDRCVQVHGCAGIKPINWQPRTDVITTCVEDGRVVLTAERYSPNEVVRVVFLEPALALALAFREDSGFVLRGSEADMRAALAKNPGVIEAGLTLLDEELPTGVGGIDLYARDEQGRLVVVELKRGRATQEAVHQLRRYVDAVAGVAPGVVRGILAAPSITQPALAQLRKLNLEFVEVAALPVETKGDSQLSLFQDA
jgi:RecB family endonuclease NucS